MPWTELLALFEPHYSRGTAGRTPVGLSIMLRVYSLQQRFAQSDPAAEDALHESAVLRRIVGIDLVRAPAPDKVSDPRAGHLSERVLYAIEDDLFLAHPIYDKALLRLS